MEIHIKLYRVIMLINPECENWHYKVVFVVAKNKIEARKRVERTIKRKFPKLNFCFNFITVIKKTEAHWEGFLEVK